MTAATQFATDLLSLATSFVQVKAKTATNAYGEYAYGGSATQYAAYVEKVTKTDRNASTEEMIVEYRAYVPSTSYSAEITDEITTPDGYTRPVVEIDVRSDEFGQQVVVLSLGRPRRY
jgi:hypothetical protein